jgi:hypothetical protein
MRLGFILTDYFTTSSASNGTVATSYILLPSNVRRSSHFAVGNDGEVTRPLRYQLNTATFADKPNHIQNTTHPSRVSKLHLSIEAYRPTVGR